MRWDIQCMCYPWFSLGIHIDHLKPYVAIHLPFVEINIGRIEQPGFKHSLRRLLWDSDPEIQYVDASEAGN